MILCHCTSPNKNVEENVEKDFQELSPLLEKELNYLLRNTIAFDTNIQFPDIFQMDKEYLINEFTKCRFFFIVKFFNIDSNLYFSFWWQPNFPHYIFSEEWAIVDTNDFYYFMVHHNHVIIIDYPESKGHGLYKKDKLFNKRALFIEDLFNNIPPVLTSREIVISRTYLVQKDTLIQVEPIVPPNYKTEKSVWSEIEIVEEDNPFF